jgi:hypothetical protein
MCPLFTNAASKLQAAYHAALPNVSSTEWLNERYTSPEWEDINPNSKIAKDAYAEESAKAKATPHEGFDFCQAVYKNALAKLASDKATKKTTDAELKKATSAAIGAETLSLLKSHESSPPPSPLKEKDFDTLKEIVNAGPGQNDATYTHRVKHLLKKIELPPEFRSSDASKSTKTRFLKAVDAAKKIYRKSLKAPKKPKKHRSKGAAEESPEADQDESQETDPASQETDQAASQETDQAASQETAPISSQETDEGDSQDQALHGVEEAKGILRKASLKRRVKPKRHKETLKPRIKLRLRTLRARRRTRVK